MFEMKTIGKPCAGKPHARFDEEAQSLRNLTGSGFTLLLFVVMFYLFLVFEVPIEKKHNKYYN